MATNYTAAAKAALARKPGRIKAAPRPQNTPGRPLGPAAPPQHAARPAAPKLPAPDRRAMAGRAAARTPTADTGPYAASLAALDTEGRQITDVERRRQEDNRKYQEWLNANNDKQAAALRDASTQQQDRSAKIQQATTAAQAQTQATLDAQRGARTGTVTSGPGNARARLAGDDTLAQALLASEQQRAGITAQSSGEKQAFLAAATAATGAADKARIRGEAGTALADVGRRKGDLLVHREDALSQERAAIAQAAADARKAQLDAAQRDRELDVRMEIAQAGLDARAGESKRDRDARERENNRDRRARAREIKLRARESGAKGHRVSDAEKRQRGDSARDYDTQIATATNAATLLIAGGKNKDGKKIPGTRDRDQLRGTILARYPQMDADAVDAAVDAVLAQAQSTSERVLDGAAQGAVGGRPVTTAAQRAEAKRRKAKRRRLQGR